MWILLDNHDSFTHILWHYLLAVHPDVRVIPSDAATVADLVVLQPERLVVSPGPERPEAAGITMDAVAHFAPRIPTLGVCLGHQAIGLHYGARLVRAPAPVHGHTSTLRLADSGHALFADLGPTPEVMRYHSLTLEGLEGTGLQPLAWAADDGTVQAVAHREQPVVGVQFHPESVGTPGGAQMIAAWANDAPGLSR